MTKKKEKSAVPKTRTGSKVSKEKPAEPLEAAHAHPEMEQPRDVNTAEKVSGVVEQEVSAPKSEAEAEEAQELMTLPAAELEKLKSEKDEYYDTLLRLKAEFENYRKRVQREFDNFTKYAAENVVLEVLPVLDNFERALSNVPEGVNDGFRQGVEIIYRQLYEALGKIGLSPIETVGSKFDPHFHEALMEVESETHDEGTVVEEFQRGYTLFDKVVRHAKVSVSSGKGEKETVPDEGDTDVEDRTESDEQ